MAIPVLSQPLKILENEEYNSGLTKRDELRIYTIMVAFESQGMLEFNAEEVEDTKGYIAEMCNDIFSRSGEIQDCKKRTCNVYC